MSAEGLTSSERAAYEAMVVRGIDPAEAREDALDGVTAEDVRTTSPDLGCGGCRGLGNHRALCPHHPDYHPYRRLERMASDIGDEVGSNDTFIANTAYGLSAMIRGLMDRQPYRRPTPPDPGLADDLRLIRKYDNNPEEQQ